MDNILYNIGEMAEWLNAAVLKTVKDASPSGVRIPVSPQKLLKIHNGFNNGGGKLN